jgi:DNA-binding transcriptional LysR family regulator
MNRLACSESFIKVVDCGSINEAAKQLHITTSALSKQIMKLEVHLGVILLKRSQSGISVTTEGQHYYHQIKSVIQDYKEIENNIIAMQAEPQGRLLVAANDYYYYHRLLPGLEKFRHCYPKITLDFEIGDVVPDFQTIKRDIVFGVSVAAADNVIQKRIDKTHYVLCASPDYLEKHGEPKSPSELLQHHYIGHSSREDNEVIQLSDTLQAVMKPMLNVNNMRAAISACINGQGIIYTHECFVKDKIKKGLLKPVLTKYTNSPVNVYVYHPYQTITSSKVRAFLSHYTS